MMRQSIISILKFMALLFLLFLVLMIVMFNGIIFHDPDEVQDWVVDDLLRHTGLAREEVDIQSAYSDPPNMAGDFGHTLCALAKVPIDLSNFVNGSEFDQESSRLSLSDLIETRATWVPPSESLKTSAYQIRILEEDADLLRYLFVPTGRGLVCYVAVKM